MVHLHNAPNDAILGIRIRFEGQLRLWRQRAQVSQGFALRLWIYKEAYSQNTSAIITDALRNLANLKKRLITTKL